MSARGQAQIVDGGKLKRAKNGGFRIPTVELNFDETNRLEQFLLDQDSMDDVRAGVRSLILAALVNPQWALVSRDRRYTLWQFRQAIWKKMADKLGEVAQEVNDELDMLANDAELEVPRAD